ncbi:polysaccharide deacetylase family protein [Desulfosporosinus lacus]|uniref:Polysaccharide deacetylase n=1 Tax=Desulfosporosinus lacus DSM 15449 TaxID=1121420 RepID=A0A1M6D6D1_9FIRM|nr:polysaccharide deacetylase family protein [Desulfosporosinus lacus]SHI68721.1 Polysaccharide deacetylase [Desulfosporosinus lacus DSM 15449]
MIILQTNLNLSAHKTIIIAFLGFVLITGFTVPIMYNQYETQRQIRSQTELHAQQLQEQERQQAIKDQQIEDAARAAQLEAERESYLMANTAYADKDYFQAIELYKRITSINEADYLTAQDQIKKSTTEMYSYYLDKAGSLSKQGNQQEAIRLLTDMSAYYPDDAQIQSDLQKYRELQVAEKSLISYKGPIEHIFFHPLLAYPSLTFDGDADSNGFNQYFVTVSEFKKILDQIYANNYILVNANALYEEKAEDGKTVLVRKELKLPPNKKPLILSVDDVNYPDYKSTNGTISKLILDSEGNVATYSVSPSGEKVVSHDNEIIPIIDAFVAEHPDFSFQGAKGILALTGYYGILGYNTNKLDSPSYSEERQTALTIIKRLKETGWTFASHGYSHLDARAESYQSLEKDTLRWKEEVESLIGPTNIYVYPFGSSVLPGNPKFQFLLDQGFNILCSVGPTPYLKATTDYVMMDRRHIDGIALYNQEAILKNLFDAKSVLDPVRPPLMAGP